MKIKGLGPELSAWEVHSIVKEENKVLEQRLRDFKMSPVEVPDDLESLERCTASSRNVLQYAEHCLPIVKRATPEGIEAFLTEAKRFPITGAQLQQILDLSPTDPTFYYATCRNLSEDQSEEMAQLVRQHLLNLKIPQ
mmetsp:Transcript_47992/g.102782  ORF Transcript_47992/g.102782 Transcript_47992/m.102782 type:complete len:138 (-) Transcript_47992:96-509(-)